MLDGGLNVAVSPDSHQKEILPQVTSSNWNSLLSCNNINTPSTLTMGSQGFSLWLALVGKDGGTGFSRAAPATLQCLRWPYWVLKRSACRASSCFRVEPGCPLHLTGQAPPCVEKAPCTDLRSGPTLPQNSYRTTQANAYVNHAHQTQAQSVNSQT